MSQLRAFLAIDIDEDLKAKIYKVIKEFKQIDANIKYVDLENLHLTLKFFGDIDTEGIDLLSSKISNVDFNLNGNIFKYITWYEKMLPKSESIQKRILFYILGISDDNNIQMDIKTVYNKYGIEYDNNIKPI